MAIWQIDPSHSEITFKVKHLVISTVSGKFNSFEGTVEAEKADFSDAKINFSADIDSITTGQEQRDGHLKSADFFDAAGHPKLTFVSKSIVCKTGNLFNVTGDLTIRGTTKPVELQVEFGGTQVDFYGNTVAGFELNGKINRQDFGLTWSAVTEAGGIVVADEVKLHMNVELHKKG
ncbi:YceI family protein [Flavihumibacter profundi]|uniref:YceI family protein n=1 Tax=Flavihumibacter profundi TaxID=2716883 RepID=UPI001CC51609|nr:YceI family protein [Flavihumibacter profundi]MBZ5859216.1 YceI family protein [Flavihumibacter profundi]